MLQGQCLFLAGVSLQDAVKVASLRDPNSGSSFLDAIAQQFLVPPKVDFKTFHFLPHVVFDPPWRNSGANQVALPCISFDFDHLFSRVMNSWTALLSKNWWCSWTSCFVR